MYLPHKWAPRKYQFELWDYLYRGGKRAVAVWHRRAGKDEVALHWTALATQRRPATYWHLLPEASQARKAIWDAVNPHTGKRRIDEVFPQEIRAKTLEDVMMIKFKNGSTWQVLGSDNYDSLVGSPPAGVVYSEYSLADPVSWGYIKPILLENSGWSLFIYTSRGQNHGADMFNAASRSPDWFAQKLTADETNVFTAEQLVNELRESIDNYGETAGTAIFRQEYYCSFDAAVLGSVYGEWIERAENEGRIKANLFDKDLEVHTAWDLGYDDATAIIFYQIAPKNEIRIIDYYENNQADIEHYVDVLKDKGYDYAKAANVPHDASFKTLQGGGRSIVMQAHALGLKMKVIPASSQANQIAATRKILNTTWFDADKAKEVVKHLKMYSYKYDEKLKIFSKDPVHDQHSHACDAFEIIGLTNTNQLIYQPKPKPIFLEDMTADDVFWPKETSSRVTRERI